MNMHIKQRMDAGTCTSMPLSLISHILDSSDNSKHGISRSQMNSETDAHMRDDKFDKFSLLSDALPCLCKQHPVGGSKFNGLSTKLRLYHTATITFCYLNLYFRLHFFARWPFKKFINCQYTKRRLIFGSAFSTNELTLQCILGPTVLKKWFYYHHESI